PLNRNADFTLNSQRIVNESKRLYPLLLVNVLDAICAKQILLFHTFESINSPLSSSYLTHSSYLLEMFCDGFAFPILNKASFFDGSVKIQRSVELFRLLQRHLSTNYGTTPGELWKAVMSLILAQLQVLRHLCLKLIRFNASMSSDPLSKPLATLFEHKGSLVTLNVIMN